MPAGTDWMEPKKNLQLRTFDECLPIFEDQIQGFKDYIYNFLPIFQGRNYFFQGPRLEYTTSKLARWPLHNPSRLQWFTLL